MAFNINDFRGELTYGGARSSLFEVTMTNPLNGAGDDKFRFVCRAAAVPAATVGVVTTPYFGRQVKHAGNRTFDPWTVTILNDEDFLVRNTLEQWNTEINTLEGNLRTGAAGVSQYKAGTADVIQYGKDGRAIRSYTFVGLWCSDLSAMDLSWDSEAIQEFTATFQYDYWVPGSTGDTTNSAVV